MATRVVSEADVFERLFTAEYARVVAIARRVLGDGPEAEDVAQEAFYAFYRQHPADAPFAAPWLHRAAAHLALNQARGRQRRRAREEREARDPQWPVAEPDPQVETVRAEERRQVREALSRLPARSAAVLALRYSGLSYAEVAASLDVSVGQIGTLLRRAEAALRKELDHETSG